MSPTPATPAPAPGGKGVGEECGSGGSTGDFSGDCQDGLTCYKPPPQYLLTGPGFHGRVASCVQKCDTDDDCASGTICNCEVFVDGCGTSCFRFCSNPAVNADSTGACFWLEIQPLVPDILATNDSSAA